MWGLFTGSSASASSGAAPEAAAGGGNGSAAAAAAAEGSPVLPPSPPHSPGTSSGLGSLPPPKATEKPKFPGREGMCTIEGCDTKVMSVTLNVSRYLAVPLPVWDKRDSKHHCRHCLRRVCSKHFTKTATGYKVCTVCLEGGELGHVCVSWRA